MSGRRIDLMRGGGETICLQIHTGKKGTRIFLTEDQAQHLSNRLQSYAHGNFGSEISVVVEKQYDF